jgi:hypothetical protein
MAMEQTPARRQNRYSDAEINLIKSTFAENDDLIFALRKLMLQMPLNPVDLEYLKVFKGNKELQALVAKAYTPQIEGDAPLGQPMDIYMLIPLKDTNPELAYPEILVYQKVITYFEEQLKRLEKPGVVNETGISFKQLSEVAHKEGEALYIDMKARNMIVVTSEGQLNMFYTMAGAKDESIEQTKKRLAQNSNK